MEGEKDACMVPDMIFYLLRMGAHRGPIRVTTGELADGIGVSQQTASRKLITLERNGSIERTDGKVMLTKKAVAEIQEFVSEVLESLKGMGTRFEGEAIAGLGQGAFFVSQKKYLLSFGSKLGFKPFPGTLNVKIGEGDIEKRILLREQPPITVESFTDGKKRFGKIDCYPCVINGLPGAVIFPEMSGHGLQVIEVISPFNLRKKLALIDGSKVNVEIA
ncbi:MAG: CTP-dependent riboflavin kinase [Candidatus Micrarchaeota archaeon]|nr:CTP-dependent riboflavin kinase [Candidatus Micrarchaeota archaeon]